jgi:hypothetical protein
MTPEEIKLLAREIAKEVAREFAALQDQRLSAIHAIPVIVPRRLTVVDFGVCCNLSGCVILRRIRSRFIDRKFVEGRPSGIYYVDREALVKFNVPLELAAERLAAHRAQTQPPFSQPSAA